MRMYGKYMPAIIQPSVFGNTPNNKEFISTVNKNNPAKTNIMTAEIIRIFGLVFLSIIYA